MTDSKLKIDASRFEINLQFYNFLKKVTQAKFTDGQMFDLLGLYINNTDMDVEELKEKFYSYIEDKVKRKDPSLMLTVIDEIDKKTLRLFVFALKLNMIKDLLLNEAKKTLSITASQLENLNKLSLEYDKKSTQMAYATRISGALLSLLFFEQLEKGDTGTMFDSNEIALDHLAKDYKELSNLGLDPNQIFMLLFSESINQSITSSAGASYEERIENILVAMGVPKDKIKKTHDEIDSSTEFDFLFEYKNRTYGIGAKRTLRERYKQFIKTSHMSKLDVMIEITLGTDLRPNIAKSIREHGVYLFVADEVYRSKIFLQEINGIYPATELTLKKLEELS